MPNEVESDEKHLVTCTKCGQEVTATKASGHTWFLYDEPGWTFAGEWGSFCPSCSRRYLKGENSA